MNEQTPLIPTLPPVMQSTNVDLPFSDNPSLREIFEGLLRRPKELVPVLERCGGQVALRLAGIALISLSAFGFVLGCFARHEQLWAAPVKIIMGMIFASLICYPSLYIFSTLAGSRFSPRLLAVCLTGAMALMGLLLLGFAPAVWIFVESSSSFGFIGFLTLAVWVISIFFGIRFLINCARQQGSTQSGPLTLWAMVFILVTLQLSTSLRPILGRSDKFLTLDEKKFFLQHWYDSADASLSNTNKPEGTPAIHGANVDATNSSVNPYSEK